ncbi:MAG: hypothetical protein FWC87_09575 [Acidimicrobiaceae bacterium]|nr:hypothetical protein [Acidimicrobiaceae bacterium]
MRSHGVSNYPDNAISSNGNGTEVKLPQGITSSPNFSSASQACQSKLPKGGNTSGAAKNATVEAEIKWANCMHKHGVPNAPEPNSQGRVVMTGGGGGVDPNSPTFQAAEQVCRHYLPNGGAGFGS